MTSTLITALVGVGEDANHSCCATALAVWAVFYTLLQWPEQSEQYLVTPHLVHAETQKSRTRDTGHSHMGHSLWLGPGVSVRVNQVSRVRVLGLGLASHAVPITVVNVQMCKCDYPANLTTVAKTSDVRCPGVVCPAVLFWCLGMF